MSVMSIFGGRSHYRTRGVREAKHALAKEFVLARRHRSGAIKAKRMQSRRSLKLHLACGRNLKRGWLNIDLFARRADLRIDLREPFPFDDGSVSVIYSEHFFEHLEYPGEVVHLLNESLRVLQPGGLFSVAVPDAKPLLNAYVDDDRETFRIGRELWHPKWCDTHMHQVNYHFRQGKEHKYAYDFETLARILKTAGYDPVAERGFDARLDSASRRMGTLYVDAGKQLETRSGTSEAAVAGALLCGKL